jgi:maltooligosyltrehalose trehalohydrolase
MTWFPSLGAVPSSGGTRFRVWAPDATTLDAVVESPGRNPGPYALQKCAEGLFSGTVGEIAPGDLYRYRIDGRGPFPDPASRFQPRGVHGPSEVVAPARFHWTDQQWTNVELEDLVLYEMHVGAFTPSGTFAAAQRRLPLLRDLGATAVELMPVADFAGDRNWGYDGVALFAPARCYGHPDDLRRFVNEAHVLGLAVHLDVVYNHLGPDGAYVKMFSPYYFSGSHRSPWGAGTNLDGRYSAQVRKFFVENALHWIHEYHIDGLRVDASHALVDESSRHFLAELTAAVRDSTAELPQRPLIIAEDHRNLARIVKPASQDGWGLDAVWSEDFHHQMRRRLAGDSDGYFADFEGDAAGIAATVKRGWYYWGQHSQYFGGRRGTDPAGIPPSHFVFYIQNHDQVGNRAMGDRLHHRIDLPCYRAATALLLLAPETPLLFMGQEWAATTPFHYFIDHHEELGRRITEGRRREFRRFAAFADPETCERIPDPQDPNTFRASRIVWQEREREPHASLLRLYKALLTLRRTEAALRWQEGADFDVAALDDDALVLRRGAPAASPVLAVIRLRGPGVSDLRTTPLAQASPATNWQIILTTEQAAFASDAVPPRVQLTGPVVEFHRPGAVVLKALPPTEC